MYHGVHNNLVKGIYAYGLAYRKTGLRSLAPLTVLAVLGPVPFVWLGS
jgi:hypothetical protein